MKKTFKIPVIIFGALASISLILIICYIIKMARWSKIYETPYIDIVYEMSDDILGEVGNNEAFSIYRKPEKNLFRRNYDNCYYLNSDTPFYVLPCRDQLYISYYSSEQIIFIHRYWENAFSPNAYYLGAHIKDEVYCYNRKIDELSLLYETNGMSFIVFCNAESYILFSYDTAELSRINRSDMTISEMVDLQQQLLSVKSKKEPITFVVRDNVVCFNGICLFNLSGNQ